MKKTILLILTLSIPVMFFFSIHQVYQYQQLEKEVAVLRNEQIKLFEDNKRMIANIAILSSPKRIARLARESLDLKPVNPEKSVLRIVFNREKDRPDG